MKKFSSFGSFLGRIPTFMPNNSATNCENNGCYTNDISSDEQNEQSYSSNSTEPQCASEQNNFSAIQQEKQSDIQTNQTSQSQDKVIFHYPQSNYDPLQDSQNNFSQNDDFASKDYAAKNVAVDPQNTDNQELSHKAKSLWQCMRTHDDIVRNLK